MRALALLSASICLAAPAGQRLTPIDETAYRSVLASNKGSVVLVDFWATWCLPCRDEMPQLAGFAQKLRPRGLKMITVSCDEPEQEAGAAAFLDKQSIAAPRYIKRARDDDKFINSVDPKWSGALPALFLYDRQGRLVKSLIGETNMTALEAELRKVL